MTTYYLAVASDGTVFRRSTTGRTYTHCVAVYSRSQWRDNQGRGSIWGSAEWAGRRELAEKAAGRQRNSGWRTSEGFHEILRVEILTAIEVDAKAFKTGTLPAEPARSPFGNLPAPNLFGGDDTRRFPANRK
jgi:hypothetical protein